MKKTIVSLLTLATMTLAQAENPFFKPFDGPYGTPKFSLIQNSHYMEAIDRGIDLANKEIDAITSNPAEPDFDNTIVALERSGEDLNRVLSVFYNILGADADDEMMQISLEASGKLSDYETSIKLNEALWKRVKAVYDKRDKLNLTAEQQTLLQNTYDGFNLSGANLVGADREKYKQLSAELSELTTKFGQNVMKELSTYEVILDKDDLAGLPQGVIDEAAELAEAKGHKGQYLFTLQQPTYMAFMKYSSRPDLRKKMFMLNGCRNQQGEYDNTEIMKRIAEVRLEIARLLGCNTYADYALKHTMAEKPAAVYDLLDRLRDAYKPALTAELDELNKFASETEGRPVVIEPWDYSYYANKLKNAKYSYDEEAMRPYFRLDSVVSGVFGLATKLYGVTFTENPSIEGYHPDVKAYDVNGADGKLLGVLYTDFFPRDSKQSGAWMTEFRTQHRDADGNDVRPLVSIVMNFTKPTADKPSLLTPYEVETFLHEFGHSLHGLLTQCTYTSVAGTNVYRDFVELPSQFNENFLIEKEFLDSFAHNYITGEPISQELVDKLKAQSQYGAAYQCMRQLGFAYDDMAWHTITEPVKDAYAFEEKATEQVQIFPPVKEALFSTTFSHIFSGGYAAGYYSYKWAEVLDADAFAMFKENGIFDHDSAMRFMHNVLEKGGTVHPAKLYRDFRGQDPTIDALLERDGIKAPADKKPENLKPRG